MNLNIKTSPKGFEVANCILGQALTELEKGEGSLLWLGFSKTEIEAGRRFSRSLKAAFRIAHKKK